MVAFHVADWDGQHFPVGTGIGEGSLDIFHPHLHGLANVLEPDVTHERPRQQAGLAQNLKAVADSQHQPTAVGKFADLNSITGENLAIAPVRR